ncbi:pyruvate carboxylase subunit B [Archaeoglobales archaeon]|nr:MAG: pyruvate carboxylase subunit B [Archaeoglobales archaeon]
MGLKEDLVEEIGRLFDDFLRIENITYEQIQWEVDNFIYPFIGSYLAEGRLTREEGRDVFMFCELRLKEIKKMMEDRVAEL